MMVMTMTMALITHCDDDGDNISPHSALPSSSTINMMMTMMMMAIIILHHEVFMIMMMVTKSHHTVPCPLHIFVTPRAVAALSRALKINHY